MEILSGDEPSTFISIEQDTQNVISICVTLWNNINPDLKLCKSIPSFKIKLKRELLQQFLDS
jgi:hypothetical protein